jgi:hypothetical protein
MASPLELVCTLALTWLRSEARGEAERSTWISRTEILALPTRGKSWAAVLSAARRPMEAADLGVRDSFTDVHVLARALVYARTGEERYRMEALQAIHDAMGTERRGDVLSLARNLPGYVIAAELVRLPPVLQEPFERWLRGLLDLELSGGSLREVHERRPNNWGTHCGAARAVIASHLGDTAELARVAEVFRGWVGERSHYDGFEFGDLDWQADPDRPVGINPRGSSREGHSLDGVLPDDQRRAGGFEWPPPKENYVYEALQGALLQAVVLTRNGHDAFAWGDRALLRAALWLEREAGYEAAGDDTWQPHVLNHFHPDARLRARIPSSPGKSVGWTDWTHPSPEAR